MTHLYIEQATDRTEEVNSSIISKLYELAISGDLDNTSDLKGRLHSPSAKEKHVTYLNNNFDDLYISADAQYLSFEDPDVETYMKRYIGNDEGVTLQDVQTFVASGTAFGENYTNTHTNRYGSFTESGEERASINSFDELSLFNGITTIKGEGGIIYSPISSITLPSSVVRLNTWAFAGCTNLSSINLNNIQYIGGESFIDTKLSGVIDLSNVIQIGDSSRGSSFRDCTSITEVNAGNNFTNFVNGSNFENCTGLTKFTGLSNLTSIAGRTFYNCNALSSVDIDWTKITAIGNNAFNNCAALTSIGSLSNVTRLEDAAFIACRNIVGQINMPNLTYLGAKVFYGCKKITQISIPSTITYYGESLFRESGITSFTIPSGVTIGPAVFRGCTDLQTVVIGSNTGGSCFEGCTSLSNVTIQEGVTELAGQSFKNTAITIIDLPSTITSMDVEQFSACSQLNTIIIRATTPPTGDSWYAGLNGNATIYVPDASVNDYKASTAFSALSSRIFGISQLPNS